MTVGNVSSSVAGTATTGTNTTAAEETILSPVQRVLKEAEARKPAQSSEPYTEQEWYINAKVAQLRGQLDFYSRMPESLSSGVMDALETEIVELVNKQRAKAKEAQASLDAKQIELDNKKREENLAAQVLTPEQLLERAQARARGEKVETYVPPPLEPEEEDTTSGILTPEQLLENAKKNSEARGSNVNTSA